MTYNYSSFVFTISNKLFKIVSSVSVSTADKQSSKSKIGVLMMALAIETRCFDLQKV
jgi:hypothetical protein